MPPGNQLPLGLSHAGCQDAGCSGQGMFTLSPRSTLAASLALEREKAAVSVPVIVGNAYRVVFNSPHHVKNAL